MLRIGSGAIHVVPRIVARALRFHHLFTGKSKWEIRAGNVLMDMHMGIYIWAFGAFITTKTSITCLKEHCTVRLLTHVLRKPTHFVFLSFIATISYSLQTSFNSIMKDWADKYSVWSTPARSPSRSNSR